MIKNDLLSDLEMPTVKINPYAYVTEMIYQLDAVCDGAVTDDEQGFAGMHTHKGKMLARKLHAGRTFDIHDIKWARKALPYYFNTQLPWADKEIFNACCDEIEKEAEKYETDLQKERKQINDIIENAHSSDLVLWFYTISANLVNDKDQRFVASLQAWGITKPYTEKQFYWIKKMLKRYWDFVSFDRANEIKNGKAVPYAAIKR